MKGLFEEYAVSNRVHFAGILQGEERVNAYHAMIAILSFVRISNIIQHTHGS